MYGAQGLKPGAGASALKGAAAAAATGVEEEEADDSSSVVERPKKKPRISSSSASSGEKLMGGFAEVMGRFLPPQQTKLTAEDWFQKLMLTDTQRAAVLALLPASAHAPSTLLMSVMPDNSLSDCGLSPIQIAAWKQLAAAESR